LLQTSKEIASFFSETTLYTVESWISNLQTWATEEKDLLASCIVESQAWCQVNGTG
jgi:hypothetical protein